MGFKEKAKDELELLNVRVRFLVANKKLSFQELSLLEKAGFQFYSDSFFYDLEHSQMLFPVVGKKRPDRSLVQEFLKAGIELENREIRFTELQTMVFNPLKGPKAPTDDELLAQMAQLYDTMPYLKEKKLLVELNSKDLALHFFL